MGVKWVQLTFVLYTIPYVKEREREREREREKKDGRQGERESKAGDGIRAAVQLFTNFLPHSED